MKNNIGNSLTCISYCLVSRTVKPYFLNSWCYYYTRSEESKLNFTGGKNAFSLFYHSLLWLFHCFQIFKVKVNHASTFNVCVSDCTCVLDCACVHLFLLLSATKRSTALITQDSQWMLRSVYTHHNKLHSPPSLLPHQVLLSAVKSVSTLWDRKSFYLWHLIMHLVQWETTV